DGFVKSLGSVILSDNEESLMPLRTMLWRFFTSFKNDIFSPFYETVKHDSLIKTNDESCRIIQSSTGSLIKGNLFLLKNSQLFLLNN
ncbi:MAG: hypothetical protein J7L86_04010, partial [Candidatus Marinimicrobia bacterium]|nr:hypothetical protein [Candidatus Neomarinimicrobiota bacterium]